MQGRGRFSGRYPRGQLTARFCSETRGDFCAAQAIRRLDLGDGFEKLHESRFAADFRQRHDEFRSRLTDQAQGGFFDQTALGEAENLEQTLA